MPGLKLSDICHKLGGYPLFSEMSLTLDGGQWHCVLGCSGIGKTSLLRLIAGLDSPESGQISDSLNNPLGKQTAYMAQDDGLLPWLSVIDNVLLGPRLRGEPLVASREKATALLNLVHLSDWMDASIAQLSGGMRQRVALARTLLEDKPIILMDEPFSRLDAITRDELHLLSTRVLKGKTVVLVTHDPIEALRLGHTIHVLQRPAATACNSRQSTHTAGNSLQSTHIVKLGRCLRTTAGELPDITTIAAQTIHAPISLGGNGSTDALHCITDLWALLRSTQSSPGYEH